MKKSGILNAHLSYLIASIGHTDKMVVCDSGLPISNRENMVDLALVENIPSFIDTLKAVLIELKIERAIIAEEMEKINSNIYEQVLQLLGGIEIKRVSHEEFKDIINDNGNISFVRTGEATPYANIILIAGVTFD